MRRAKRVLVYGQLISPLTNGLAPIQAIGLPILPNTPAIMRSIHSNAGFSKKTIIAQVIESNSDRIVWNEKQMDQLYEIAMRCKNNSITTQEQLINELRGGGLPEAAALIGIIGAVVLTLYLSEGFQVPRNPSIVPPHLEWLYGNQRPGNDFGYGKGAGPRSITVTGATQNAGSDKKQPSSGSWNYIDVMRQLDKQSNKKIITIPVYGETYAIKNPNCGGVDELSDKLAYQIYDSIRACDTDICDIAENLGFKAENIKKVKDHVFYNEHDLDRYSSY